MIVALIGLLLCLAGVFYEDWKYRSIHIVLPVVIFLCSFYLVWQQKLAALLTTVYNTIFFSVVLLLTVCYISLKNRKFLNPFAHYFGFGDFMFYVAISPLFWLQNYVLFFILSMVFALFLQFILKKILMHETIPLAGYSAILLLMLIGKDLCWDVKKITLL